MKIWIDAQLSPSLAAWINRNFPDLIAESVWGINLREATDREIFEEARKQKAVVMTKDNDFLKLLEEFGPPPQVIWVTCGNTSNQRMRQLLSTVLDQALDLLEDGEPLVEISER